MAKRKLTGRKLKALYRLLSVPMIDFDCGKLCAPGNDGVPLCCDHRISVPLLLRDEFRWHRKRHTFWKKMPRKSKSQRALAEECRHSPDVLALCPGPAKCEREKRAFACRTFPFEPHCDAKGRVLGLAFNYTPEIPCPLRRKRKVAYNPEYIRNAIKFWNQILEIFPEERSLYTRESKKLRREARRKGRKVRLFK